MCFQQRLSAFRAAAVAGQSFTCPPTIRMPRAVRDLVGRWACRLGFVGRLAESGDFLVDRSPMGSVCSTVELIFRELKRSKHPESVPNGERQFDGMLSCTLFRPFRPSWPAVLFPVRFTTGSILARGGLRSKAGPASPSILPRSPSCSGSIPRRQRSAAGQTCCGSSRKKNLISGYYARFSILEADVLDYCAEQRMTFSSCSAQSRKRSAAWYWLVGRAGARSEVAPHGDLLGRSNVAGELRPNLGPGRCVSRLPRVQQMGAGLLRLSVRQRIPG